MLRPWFAQPDPHPRASGPRFVTFWGGARPARMSEAKSEAGGRFAKGAPDFASAHPGYREAP
jgi:hypothetical protein